MIDLMFSGRNLFLLYIALSANFLKPLIPTSTTRLMSESMPLRHLLGLVGVAFFSVVSEADFDDFSFNDLMPILACSVFIYLWFLLASKMTANWWIPLVLILVTLYLVNLYKIYAPKLTKDTVKNLDFTEYVLLAASAITTMVGFFIYMGEKKTEYRSKFSFETFLFGTTELKNTPNRMQYWDSFKAAFFVAPGTAFKNQSGGGFVSDEMIRPVSSFDYVPAS